MTIVQGRRNRGGHGGPCPPNNLHKYAVLLITKVCHFKKFMCAPPQSVKKLCVPPQSVIASYGPVVKGITLSKIL